MSEAPNSERVYSVPDWYDGPRSGVADFGGRPHLFMSTWQDLERKPDVFLLWPISDEELALVVEDWSIWRRYQVACRAGQTSRDTHPALPEERARHEQLEVALLEHDLCPPTYADLEPDEPAPKFGRTMESAIRAMAEFEPSNEDNEHASLRVRWSLIDPIRD